MADIEVEDAAEIGGAAGGAASAGKRFEVKKWNAVALWAWDIVVDNCAICRNHIMDLCIECQAHQASATSEECTVAWYAPVDCVTFPLRTELSLPASRGTMIDFAECLRLLCCKR